MRVGKCSRTQNKKAMIDVEGTLRKAGDDLSIL